MDNNTQRGLIRPFKNSTKQYAGTAWQEVDVFLHTWGFLPTDKTELKKIPKEVLEEMCLSLMNGICLCGYEDIAIQRTQEKMKEIDWIYNILSYFNKKTNKKI